MAISTRSYSSPMKLLALAFLLTALSTHATTLDEAQQFFASFTNLTQKVDLSLGDLYADDAVITSKRLAANGKPEEFVLKGSDYKTWLTNAALAIKVLGRKTSFAGTAFKEEKGKVTITYMRHTKPDDISARVVMVIAKRGEKLLIQEQTSETLPRLPLEL